MEWKDLPDSELFRSLRSGKLPHPTQGAFDPTAWAQAAKQLKEPNHRDLALLHAALRYGHELSSLRTFATDKMAKGITKGRAVRLLSALANQQFLTLRNSMREQTRKLLRRGPMHMEQLAQQPVEAIALQELNADDHVTSLVDSLPHWLFHIWASLDDATAATPSNVIGFGARALAISSIEHGFRDLWQGVLWLGHDVSARGDVLVDSPTDRKLAEMWFIWHLRQQSLAAWEQHVDAGAAVMVGTRNLSPVKVVVDKTVVKLKRRANGRRGFIIGTTDSRSSWQRVHAAERDMLERQYTGLFLDEPLPKFSDQFLTCRDLCKAWWVISDLARLIVSDLGAPIFNDDRGTGKFSIPIESDDIEYIISDCLAIDAQKSKSIVDMLTASPSNTNHLFSKGIWSTPLLPAPTGTRRHILLAPLLVGSPTRRVEDWLERGGVSDQSGLKGRGKPFENYARKELREAISSNSKFKIGSIFPESLKRKGSSEEIDLILMVGKTIIIGEIKCFTQPSEALEKYNYLNAVNLATKQANAKLSWAMDNKEIIANKLEIFDQKHIDSLKFLGLVVLNQSFGLGLSRNGIPVVDLHYLKLIIGSHEYQGETWFEKDKGMRFKTIKLYHDQDDFELKISTLLQNPPPLERYASTIGWRSIPFQTESGRGLFIDIPTLNQPPV